MGDGYNEENTKGGRAGGAARKVVNSDAYRGISSALMRSAYKSMGKAFDAPGYTPRGQRPDTSYLDDWSEAGAAAQKRLEDRWHMADFKNFRKNHLNQYQEDMQELGDKVGYLTSELKEGLWYFSETESPEELDMTTEEGRMKSIRMSNRVEQEAVERMTELQINLNTVAAEKYAKNPIVDNLIQKMMESQMQNMAAQFNPTQSMAGAQSQQQMRAGEADIAYKKSLTRQANAQAEATGGKYKTTDAVFRDLSPSEGVRFLTNNVEGQQLLAGTGFPSFHQSIAQREVDGFIKRKGWTPDEAVNAVNAPLVEAFRTRQAPRIRELAMYEWLKQEYGADVADGAARERPDMKADLAKPFKYDVKATPSKKAIAEKSSKWATLGVEVANEQIRREGISKAEATDWLLSEWLPAALDGQNIQEGGAYTDQFEGLTADALNKAAAPYLKAVRAAVAAAAKRIGTGPGTEEFGPGQRVPDPRRAPRGRTGGGLGRAMTGILDDDVYPTKFREKFPQKTKEE